jgi:hypothetical protein
MEQAADRLSSFRRLQVEIPLEVLEGARVELLENGNYTIVLTPDIVDTDGRINDVMQGITQINCYNDINFIKLFKQNLVLNLDNCLRHRKFAKLVLAFADKKTREFSNFTVDGFMNYIRALSWVVDTDAINNRINEQDTRISTRINGLEQHVQAMNQRIDELERTMNEGFAGIHEAIAALATRQGNDTSSQKRRLRGGAA